METIDVASSDSSHLARHQRTLSGRPILGPYESFPDVHICRGRRKDVASMSRPSRTRELRFTDTGTYTDVRQTFKRAQSRSVSQRHECDVIWITITEWELACVCTRD